MRVRIRYIMIKIYFNDVYAFRLINVFVFVHSSVQPTVHKSQLHQELVHSRNGDVFRIGNIIFDDIRSLTS